MSASEPPATARRPVIGVTSYLQRAQTGIWDLEASFLPKIYLDGIAEAGGIPVVLPPQALDEGVAAAVIERVDGLVIAGGVDVEPSRYGQQPHAATDAPQPLRDAWDLALLGAAIAAELPFLAICRGAQVLNVLRGGTLIQHLPEVIGDTRYQLGNGEYAWMPVATAEGSRLAEIVGSQAHVHLYHHQAVDELGEGLVVTARSADGVVEGLELPSVPFGVAVQWHPERNAEDRRLFAALTAAAIEKTAGRSDARRNATQEAGA